MPGPGIELAWGFTYPVGTDQVRVPLHGGADGPAVRDREAERELLDQVAPVLEALPGLVGEVDGETHLLPRTTLTGLATVRFAGDVQPVLENAGVDVQVVGEPTEFRWTDSAPLIEVSATESGERDWFDLGVTVSVDGEQIPFHPLFVALAQGDSHLVLDSGTWFSIERPELAQLRTLIEEARELQDRPTDDLRISAYQADLWDELTHLGVVQEQSARWDAAVKGLLEATPETDPAPVPPGLRAELRPYQLDGFRWLAFLRRHGLGGILADDMGLGKTVQALAMVLHAVDPPEGPGVDVPFLVVAPTSVVPNWVHEAERFAPGLRVVPIGQTERTSSATVAEQVAGAHLVVTSYSLFRLDAARLPGPAVGGAAARRGAVRQEPPGPHAPGRPAPGRAVQARDHRHAAGEQPDGAVVAAVDRRARAVPEPPPVRLAVRQPHRQGRQRAPRAAASPDPPAHAAPHQGGRRLRAAAQGRAGARGGAQPEAPPRSTRPTCSGSGRRCSA